MWFDPTEISKPRTYPLATLATLPTEKGFMRSRVAEVAKVATPFYIKGSNQAANNTISANDITLNFRWLIHFSDREPVICSFSPMVNHTGALAYSPRTVAAEPITNEPKQSATNTEMVELRTLIAAIYQDDTEDDRLEAEQAALSDPMGALLCYRALASVQSLPPSDDDDRNACQQCHNLRGRICTIATPGGRVSAVKGYRPCEMFREQLHRCEGYEPRCA
jgi:hypothetical protein